jgi:predicted transcriptional regulator
MEKHETRPVTIRISAGKIEDLDELAAATDRTRAWHVEQALDAYLDLQRWQVRHIAEGLAQLEAGEGIPQVEIETELDTWGDDEAGPSK